MSEIKGGVSGRSANDVISVLSSEYNAVYYCNEDTHEYDILFQQGFVREQLDQMQKMFPRYEDSFKYFISMLVHPDDRESMAGELARVPELLQRRKSVRIEFRRLYGDKYLYTEMYCVKVGEAQDELHDFVAGFAENDARYRASVDQQRQLEILVAERTADLQNKNRTLTQINDDIIELLGNLTEARDTESGEHIRRVKGFTNILARQVMQDWPEYGLTGDVIDLITSASALHDVGKITIPDAILLKPGRLTPEEFSVMKSHCNRGCDILRLAPEGWSRAYLNISMDICHYHHERWDGNGYPEGLKGDDIPISAQIVAVADCFDALISERVYKKAYTPVQAYEMILSGACGAFSDKLMLSFRACRSAFFIHAGDQSSRFAAEMPAGISTASLSWLKILFVDDSELTRQMGADILREEGAAVTEASGGREAIELFCKSAPGYFDAIVMDILMPDMSGVEAVKIIRALDRDDAATIPVIALTSLSSSADLDMCLDGGMDSFITKPISISALNKVLYECLRARSEALSSAVMLADRDAGEKADRIIQRTSYLTGVSAEYAFSCYVDGNTNDVSGFRCGDELLPVFGKTGLRLPPNRRLDKFFAAIVPAKDFEKFKEDANRSRIIKYLRTSPVYQVLVPVIINNAERLYSLKVIPDDENAGCFLIALQSVDNAARAEIRSRNLIQALAESYVIIDFIDFEKDTYMRCRSDDAGSEATVLSGSFTQEVSAYVSNFVHPDDRAAMAEFLNPAVLRAGLMAGKKLSMRYRSVKNGNTHHFEVQIVNGRDDISAKFAILTLSDIQESVELEARNRAILNQTRKRLEDAERLANRDPLTGVKNITAYTVAVSELSGQLKASGTLRFAAVMCDVNNLKLVNDTNGHDTGDIYIRNCCHIICDVFKRSPVYRIGGDEFVAILTDADYVHRDALMQDLGERISLAESFSAFSEGRASFAYGIAEFDPAADYSVADVVKRADAEMYRNKNTGKREAQIIH